MLDANLETDMTKKKAQKLHQNQKHDKNTPKLSNASFELQVKQHAKRGFSKELKLINIILDTGNKNYKEDVIIAV